MGVSGPSSSRVQPSHRHLGFYRHLCSRGGSHVISQVLHRGRKYSNSCISYFLTPFPQFLHLLPLPFCFHQFPQDPLISSFLKAPVLSLSLSLSFSPLYFLPLYLSLFPNQVISGDLTKLDVTLILLKVFRVVFQIFLAFFPIFRKIV